MMMIPEAWEMVEDGLLTEPDFRAFAFENVTRLHTQMNLMDELEKIKRVMGKLDAEAPHETLLVLDAGTGQNALTQASNFRDTVGVSGIILTKLDGTAKGGMIFNVATQLQTPIRYIGVGESVEDLRPFDHESFVDALLAES